MFIWNIRWCGCCNEAARGNQTTPRPCSFVMEKKVYRIETPRLVLRCYQPSDAPLLLSAIEGSLPELKEWLPWAKYEPEELSAKVERLRRFRGDFDLGNDFIYGIFDKNEDVLIGSTGLHTRLGEHAREIGYWVNTAYGGQGYVTEAVQALLKIGFDVENLNRIEIRCDPRNEKSRKIPEKLGFKLEAVLKDRLTDNAGEWRDVMIWTLFRAEYAVAAYRNVLYRAFDAAGYEMAL